MEELAELVSRVEDFKSVKLESSDYEDFDSDVEFWYYPLSLVILILVRRVME